MKSFFRWMIAAAFVVVCGVHAPSSAAPNNGGGPGSDAKCQRCSCTTDMWGRNCACVETSWLGSKSCKVTTDSITLRASCNDSKDRCGILSPVFPVLFP